FHQFLLGRRLLWFRGRGRGLLLQRRWNRKAGTRLGAQRRAGSPRALPDATRAPRPTRPARVGAPPLPPIPPGAAWGGARRSLGARVRRSLASIRRRRRRGRWRCDTWGLRRGLEGRNERRGFRGLGRRRR